MNIITVVKVEPIKGEVVEMSDGTCYIRYSSDNWRERIGESTETVFSCDRLEKTYQKFRLPPIVYTKIGSSWSFLLPKKRGGGYLKTAIPADHMNALSKFIADAGIPGDVFGCDGPLDYTGAKEDIIPVLMRYFARPVTFIEDHELYWSTRLKD